MRSSGHSSASSPSSSSSSSSSFLLLLILLAPLLLSASSPPQQLHLRVGRPFTLATAEGHAVDAEMLPRWCRFNASSQHIYGIPQLRDLGHHIISIHDGHVEVDVAEEEEDFCGVDTSTTWLEIMDARRLDTVSIEEQFQTVQTLLSETLKEAGVRMSELRVLPRDYLNRYRIESEIIHKLDADEDDGDEAEAEKVDDTRMTIVMNVSCGELNEQASEIISAVAEDGMKFQVVEGVLRKDRAPLETSTASSVQQTRTTRRVHNNRPIVLNPLKSFHCLRGLLCRLAIDDNTFMDPEDGPTSRLAISAHAIGNHSNFLFALPGANQLEGVPLDAGEYSFRLEARDRMGLANSAPFQVLVKESISKEKPTHRYSLLLDVPLERFSDQSDILRDFVYRLSSAIHRIPLTDWTNSAEKTQLATAATEIQVDELIDNGGGQTMLKWSNATLSRKICDDRQINATRDRMMHTSSERVRHDFLKAMGARFHVRKVSVEYLGRCLTRHLLSTMRIRVTTTTERNVMADDAGAGSWMHQLLVPLILLIIILLLCMILLLFCLQYKRTQKGAKFAEFTTKGRPVVFPDEVPHREESSSADGSLATVTTPMLVEREQPPEQPPAGGIPVTMHENPLYRAPPQAQAVLKKSPVLAGGGHYQHEQTPLSTNPTSPRTGYAHQRPGAVQQQLGPSPPSGQTYPYSNSSTFSPPGQSSLKHIDSSSPTPLRHHHHNNSSTFLRDQHQQKSMRGLTPMGQRLPPPYLAH